MAESSFLATNPNRRANFPDWPDWALALIIIKQGFTGTNPTFNSFSFSITVADTPENREAFSKAPRPFSIANEIRPTVSARAASLISPNTLTVVLQSGDPWALWAPALARFGPGAPALSTSFEADPAPPFSVPSPNDLLPDALLLRQTEGAFPQLIPGDILDPIDEEDTPPDPPPTARAQYPNLFPNALEAF